MEKKNLIIPTHVGIIVDGNGRWAQARGLSRSEGHRAGFNRLKEICIYAGDLGVKYLSLYVFSTENIQHSAFICPTTCIFTEHFTDPVTFRKSHRPLH